MGRKTAAPNEPEDIRQYDNDPRSPYYQAPAAECEECGLSFNSDHAFEQEGSLFCSEECLEDFFGYN